MPPWMAAVTVDAEKKQIDIENRLQNGRPEAVSTTEVLPAHLVKRGPPVISGDQIGND
jgi:hypothetical protein